MANDSGRDEKKGRFSFPKWRKSLNQKKSYVKVMAITSVGLMGCILTYASGAATPTASFEPESGTAGGPASTVFDTSASGGSAIMFKKANTSPLAPMKMIGLNKPVYASTGTATNANDSLYSTYWSPGTSGWLAFDLSSEPAANRQSIALAWYSQDDDSFSVNGHSGTCAAWPGRPYIQNYTIQVNAAPGGGSAAPTSGWQTVVTVSNNGDLFKGHKFDFAGYNWVRINANNTNGNGIDVNIDVVDASGGITDGMLFVGDSITAGYAGHFVGTGLGGTTVRSYTEMVSAGTAGVYRPMAANGGMPCSRTDDALVWIDELMNAFPGKFVTLNFGTNDSWDGSGNPTGYYNNLQLLVNKIRAKGKTAVIPTMPWPNTTGAWQTNAEAMNAKILELYTANPDIIRGPDIYTITKGHPEYFQDPGNVHFNDLGASVVRKAWADNMLTRVYK